ncbi:uncharacterized protein LOC121383008 [Gigantopelta aegis]|uniref:uncharacterized protein LOC121383008 n=1 Tax=Gigantopelta aegis TaxID=1735272 RepID=UPI001B888712|nr:uncharacterized protein LOC121383008 [Gigantopelta aegis]
MSKKGSDEPTRFFKFLRPRFKEKRKQTRQAEDQTAGSILGISTPQRGSSLGLETSAENCIAEPMSALKDEVDRMSSMFSKTQEVLEAMNVQFGQVQRSLADISSQLQEFRDALPNKDSLSGEAELSLERVDAYRNKYLRRMLELQREKSAVFANILAPYKKNQADLERLIGLCKDVQGQLQHKSHENAELESMSSKYEDENENLIAGIRRLRSENWDLELYLNSQAERISRSYRCTCIDDDTDNAECNDSLSQAADQDTSELESNISASVESSCTD